MNIMRKLLVGHSRPVQEDPQQQAQHTALGLMHLKKLFSEFSHLPATTPQKEQEDKLYNMLPLFCKVFGNSPAKDMTEKFVDILPFCQQVSKLMVSEIRRRASNQSTEAASCAIVKFLEIESTEESSSGWMLLTTINLLAAGDPSLIEVMTASSLPSTLVKCLYLFFDLPEVDSTNVQESDSEFTPRERRILLTKIFVQVLVRLCTHVAPAEELARKDDLTLLFSAITSWCPQHNVPWRKSAAEVLMTLSRHCLSPQVVSYIHNKGCISLCIENMQRVPELAPLEIVEMLVTVFCFLKDSTEVAQTLLDGFRSCQGYIFLSEFLLRLEQSSFEESQEALRNLVFLVASLSMCGYIELKPSQASSGSLFQMQGFHIPQPSGRGVSIRNIQAFQVLQTVFLKATSTHLCSFILDAISGVYHSDTANYFILEPQHTLSQFSEKIHLKPTEVQEKFFQIMEFIVSQLSFVPCKELISLSILLKTQSSVECSIICMRTLLTILKHDPIFKDVYREVGLLEVMVTCLHRYAGLLKETHSTGDDGPHETAKIPDNLQTLGFLVMEALTVLVSNNNSNAGVFRECGGARCAHNMVPYPVCRKQALGIVQQLVLCNGGDDDMGTLLGMMHSAPVLALEFKTHILKSLLHVLRESHRTRTVFRKVGGFVYVMTGLVSMGECLADPPKPPWDTVDRKLVLTLLKMVFNTLTVAMRFEPANAKFFAQEICYTSLTDTIRLLGCFTNDLHLEGNSPTFVPQEENAFNVIFTSSKDESIPAAGNMPKGLAFACLMLRLLYDMALDAFDRPSLAHQSAPKSPTPKHSSSVETAKNPPSNKRHNLAHLNLTPTAPDPVIVHPGVVIAILHLLPSIKHPTERRMAMTLQLYTTEILKSLVRNERNQQVMCNAGMPHELLSRCSVALEDESHFLHGQLQYMLERLAAQALDPKDLRDFLRLGYPLGCKPFDSWKLDFTDSNGNTSLPANKREGGPVPLTRVKTLVSMTTPRDFRVNGVSLIPPFVEFDMSHEGFGCLYLPSIAPQSVSGPSVVGVGMVSGGDVSVLGGVGTGDRIFPPQTGLTYSSWICVEKFSDPRNDPHCVCLLSLLRHVHNREDHLLCLSVLLSARDKALIISTSETLLSNAVSADWEPDVIGDGCIRIWCPELIQEGQWHHIVLVLSRAVLKNSSVSLYIDGVHIKTQRLHYISQNPGGGAANLTVASSVYGYIGTPPSRRRHSRLAWKQGPCHLLEDMLSAHTVYSVFKLGPNYLASFQAPILNANEVINPLVPEDKVIFGLNSIAMSGLTLARIRKVYSKIDSKSIAKQLGMSSHENATPIYILHNSAAHLSGPARSLGGVLIGYLGARIFCSRPVARMIENVGGCPSLLGLIAMANDVEGLYAAVKALVCIVRSNKATQLEMDRIRGYQTLAMLLKKKRLLLNSHILHLTFSLVGTVDSGRENTSIPNTTAFLDLLSDLEIWHDAPSDLQRSLFEHFYELVTESSEQKVNLRLMRNLGMVPKLLHILKDPHLSNPTLQTVNNLLAVLLHNTPNNCDLLKFGQFVASTLPTYAFSEKQFCLDEIRERPSGGDEDAGDTVLNILLRNRCLTLLFSLLQNEKKTVNHLFCEDVARTLGFDWLLLFLQGHLHSTTVILALRILLVMLSNHALLLRFREGTGNGGWLQDTEPVLENRMGVVLGFNVGTASSKLPTNRDIKEDAFHVPGFQVLQWLLPKHIHTPELYFLLLALLLGQPVKHLPCNLQLNLDSIWSFMFGVPSHKSTSGIASRVEICPDAVLVILAMIRTMLNQPADNNIQWLKEYPVTLIQFLLYLYHNTPEFIPVCMTAEVLCGLASTLFLYKSSSESNSEVASPVDDFRPYPGAEPIVLVKAAARLPPSSLFTSHPAKKFVIDFLRVIVVDSLSFPVTSKSPPVIDLLLEAAPEQSSQAQQCEFQTEILVSLMDHLLAADVLLGEESALPIVAGGSYSYITSNVFYLTTRIVDKLWQGTFTKPPNEVFEFIVKLINQAKRRSSHLNIEPLFHCLNRTILYQLSRPTDTVADQTAVLEALHKLTNNRNIVLGPGNYEQEFISCLCYCLLQLTEEFSITTDSNRKTTWHINPATGTPKECVLQSAQEGQSLLVKAAKRVWEELYFCKKPAIEEVFKVNFPSQGRTPDLQTVRDMIYESASRMWLTYLDSEKKSSYKATWELHSQLQQMVNFSGLQKLQKVTGGLTRLASRKARREETIKFKMANVSMQDVQNWTFTHISIASDLVELQYKQYQQSHQHMQKYVFEEWFQTETELTRERGIWGPPVGSSLDKWMLDMTEGPCRMRKKMMKNELFYLHYPFRPEIENGENKALKYKVAMSYDSRKYYQCQRSAGMVEREAVPVELSSTITAEELQTDVDISEVMRKIGFQGLRSGLISRPSLNRNTSELDDEQDSVEPNSDTNEDGEDKPDNQTLLRLLEEGEKISHMFRCARIQGLDTSEGLLLFGKEHFYVVDGFTLLKTREIKDIDYLPANMYDPIIPNSTNYRNKREQKKLCSKFAYEDVREVHKRRYLLQPIALEVFSADGRNYLLAFPRGIRNKIYQRFMAMATAINDNAQQSVAGQKRTANVEQSASLLSSLIGETSVTQRWVREEISNFQYLMYLNTLAGRSYNDLMQYPVFPWILADYDSEELDYTDPATFRDFSKPMGAQSPERLRQFKKRYKEWDDPHGETPPYHYGTHYSSAMIVASYLVRMEPFTQHFLRLQGGHFDLADRMFHSIREAWLSASKHNMADVKELIPEFFYLQEFLVNSNNFDLGCKQNGIQLNDVILPAWAKGDPREFIRVHRQALECDYVSAHLHEWIDLIFGYKQHGQASVEATNVFHHLFYEGNVDIYSIDDPLKKNATIGFINNFGQIPKQLFKKPHPAKKLNHRTSLIDPIPLAPSISCSPDKLFFHNLDNLRPSVAPIKELKGPVGQIIHNDKTVLAVEQNKVLIPATYSRYLAWGFADQSLRIGNYESDKATFVYEMLQYGEVLCSACPNSKTIITAGTSTVVNVWEFNKKQLVLKQSLYGHTEAVTCVAASQSYNLIVSGSRDRTCILWDMSRLIFVRQLAVHAAPVAAVSINELTGDIATCAGTYLYLWSINGNEIANVNTATGRSDRLQQILCVSFSQIYEWDPLNVMMTGSSDGVVRMWSADYVQVPVQEESTKASTKDTVDLSLSSVESPSASLVLSKLQSPTNDEAAQNGTAESRIQEYVRRLSLAGTQENKESSSEIYCWMMGTISPPPGTLAKSGSESSLSDDEGVASPRTDGTPSCPEDGNNGAEPSQPVRPPRRAKPTALTAKATEKTEPAGDTSNDENGSRLSLIPPATFTSSSEESASPLSVVVPPDSRLTSDMDTSWPHSETEIVGSSCGRPSPSLLTSTDTSAASLPSIKISTDSNSNGSIGNKSSGVPNEKGGVSMRKSGTGGGLAVANHIHRSSTVITSDNVDPNDDSRGCLRFSKSDTSLSDSFVMVTESDISEASDKNLSGENPTKRQPKTSHNRLREGFKWQCQLVFRSKLTMHTAYDRKDNTDPAAVTTIAISRDHKTVYVGDAKGRVFSWSVTDHPGRVMADHWVRDEGVDSCTACNIKFTFSERKHHCRNCGQLFCSRCSRFESEISRLRILKPVRVCQTCYTSLKNQQRQEATEGSI